jgi:hypothetical protein
MKAPWLAALAILCGVPRAASTQSVPEDPAAIGDIHGDYETFRGLLKSIRLIDESDRWCGGKRRLIQTGDFLDRGAGSRQVMDLLMRLEVEAKEAGGAVVVLLGNHEVMNLVGDSTSTTREEFAAYADLERPEDRAAARAKLLKLLRDGSPLLGSTYWRDLSRVLGDANFDRWFPPGYFGHQAALAPTGKYGRWLLTHDVIHREGRTLLLHGGLSAKYGALPTQEINRLVKDALRSYSETVRELETLGVFVGALGAVELSYLLGAEIKAGQPKPELKSAWAKLDDLFGGVLFSADGPLWYRGLATEPESILWRTLEGILRAQDAERIIIGHTQPKSLTVEGRFGNRVILIDTGMNQAVYRGHPSAVFLSPGGVRVWQK